jgi:hypothetical protein
MTNDDNKIWETLGEHKGKLVNLEAGQYQMQQSIINVRAELTDNFKRHEDRVEKWLHEVKDDFLTPLAADVSSMKRFIYLATGGGIALFGLLHSLPLIQHFFQVIGK